MQEFLEKNKKVLLAFAAALAVFVGVYSGTIDISFLGGLFGNWLREFDVGTIMDKQI